MSRVNPPTEASKSFHSFRHTFIDNLRDERELPSGGYVSQEDIALVVGHISEAEWSSLTNPRKRQLETVNYGANEHLQLKRRKQIVDLVSYPSVDWGAIVWKPQR